jgi:hypothetical protein
MGGASQLIIHEILFTDVEDQSLKVTSTICSGHNNSARHNFLFTNFSEMYFHRNV